MLKKITLDNYEIIVEDGKMIIGSYIDYNGNKQYFEITEKLEKEFRDRLKYYYREQWEKRVKIDTGINTDEEIFEIRISMNSKSAEDIAIANEVIHSIKAEINKLPKKQRKRTYLKVISEFTLTEIARIENCKKQSIQESVDAGISKIIKKFKKF